MRDVRTGTAGKAPRPHHVAALKRADQIHQHVTHYAENPRAHAQALKKLGMPSAEIRQIHQSYSRSNSTKQTSPKPTNAVTRLPPRLAAGHTLKQVQSFNKSGLGLPERFANDLIQAAVYSPAGAYQVGKAGYHDVGDTIHGKPTLKRTGKIGKAIGKGVAEDFKHPLRHPGNVALDLSAVVGAAEGIGARAASRSIRRPLTGTIEHRVGDMVVKTPASKRPLVAKLQRKMAAGENPKRAGKALTQEQRILEAQQRAPAEALAHRSRKLTTPQQTALRVVNEGKPVAERIKFHEKQMQGARGASVRKHRQKILLLKAADRYVNGTELKPVAEAASRKEAAQLQRLHDTQANLERVAKTREVRLAALGKLEPGQVEGRLHGPGRVIGGAKFERTPAVKGRIEQVREYPARSKTVTRPRTADEAKARLSELDAQYENLLSKVGTAVNPHDNPQAVQLKRNFVNSRAGKGKFVGTKKQPTVTQEARRLAETKLDAIAERNPGNATVKRYIALRDERAQLQHALNEHSLPTEEYRGGHKSPDVESGAPMHELTKTYPADVYDKARQVHLYGHGGGHTAMDRRTFAVVNKVRGNPDAQVTVYRGVPGDVHKINPGDWVTPNKQYAEEHAAGEAGPPGYRYHRPQSGWHVIELKVRAGDLYTQGDSIHEYGWHPSKVGLGNVTETIPGKPRRVHLREVAAQRKSARLVGAEDFAGGKARIPYTPTEAPKSHRSAAAFRGGIPKTPSSLTHEFTGGLLKGGNFRDDTARLVAESGVEAQRHSSLLRLRDRVISAGQDEPFDGAIPVRLDSLKGKPFPPAVKEAMRKREEGVKLSRDERDLLKNELDQLRGDIFPKDIAHEATPGVKWVDPELLGGMDKQPLRLANAIGQKPVATIDAINNASKLAILYLKPAYAVPNIAGNAFLNIAQQGPHALGNWWLSRSHSLERKLGPDATAALDSVMGEGVAGSISSNAGIGAKVVQGAAGKWSMVVDRVFRRAAFMHEAKRLGFKTSEQLRSLLTDETHQDALVEAGQRAKDAIIDYDHLGQAEKEIVRRVIFFYPWVKGSTRYAGHYAVEHPIQTAATGEAGRYGREHIGLGPTPSYLEGAFNVGHNKLVNPAAAAVFQTPAQVAQIIQGITRGNVTEAARATNLATPALDLALSLATRQDSFGNPISPKASGFDIAKSALLESTPQYTLYKRLTQDNKGKLFPLSPKEALAQFTVGGIAPRSYDPKVLHAQAKKEQRSLMSPHERVIGDYKTRRSELAAAMSKVGEKQIPKEVAGRYALRAERAYNRVNAAGGHKIDSTVAFSADVDLLVRHKWMKPDEAAGAKSWFEKASKRDRSSASRYLTTHYFDQDGLLSATFKYLRENGSPALDLPALP